MASADTTTTEPWVSVEQVAQHLGVAKDTVYRWREHRGLPAHRVGRLWTFKLSDTRATSSGLAADVGQAPARLPGDGYRIEAEAAPYESLL